jgi:hypothetical protein
VAVTTLIETVLGTELGETLRGRLNRNFSNRHSWAIRSISADTTVVWGTDELILVDASGGMVVVNFPASSGNANYAVRVKPTSVSGGVVRLKGHASENIDTANTLDLSSLTAKLIVCDGTQLWVAGG